MSEGCLELVVQAVYRVIQKEIGNVEVAAGGMRKVPASDSDSIAITADYNDLEIRIG